MPQILFEEDPDFRVGYAWVSEVLKRGAYLHPYHNMFLSRAHSLGDVALTLAATDDAFAAVKQRRGSLEPHPIVAQMLAH
jgi:glutamate-1-semialdehyde 2,1-aminomutase